MSTIALSLNCNLPAGYQTEILSQIGSSRHYYAPQKQKGLLDRYNIYVLALGHFFHLVWGTEEINDWIFGFLGALAVELVLWEMVGNSDYVVTRIRDSEETHQGGTIGPCPPPPPPPSLTDTTCCPR